MADISITYDKQHYAPGDSVTARIEVRVKHSPLKLFSIECSVIGRATVQWQEYEPGGMAGNYKNYSSSHTYISLSEILLTPPKNDESISLSVGLHTFEYKFTLPLACDSTYYNANGCISYKCMVEIFRPVFKSNIRAQKQFIVSRPVDLRLYYTPTPQIASVGTLTSPSSNGSITIKGILREACYLPGETIHLEATFLNKSPTSISLFEVRLIEVTSFIGFSVWRNYERVINKELVNLRQEIHIAPGSDYNCSRKITIPKFRPTNNTCTFIIVKYYVELLVTTSSPATKLSLKIPVVIGTIPYNVS